MREELEDQNDAFMNNFKEAMPNQNHYNADNVGLNHVIGEPMKEQKEDEEVDEEAQFDEILLENADTFVVEEKVVETK